MLYEFNKFKFNALFGGAEGVGEFVSSIGELFGADIDNPLASEKPNLFRDAMGAMTWSIAKGVPKSLQSEISLG